jgi:hypothetical protein
VANYLEEYLVRLGASVDQAGFAHFQNALRESAQLVDANAMSMAKSALKTETALVSGFMAIGGAAIGLADKVAMADQSYRLFGLHMMMNKDAARGLKIAMDSLGESMADIMWDPELRGRTAQLTRDQRAMAPAGDFDAQMRKIRDIRFEFTRMEVELQYLGMNVVQNFMKALGLGPDDLLAKLRTFNDWVTTHIPQISAMLTKYFLPVWRDVERIMTDVWHVAMDFATVFDNIIGMISGDDTLKGAVTFDKFARSIEKVVHWMAKVADFLVKITGLLAGTITGGTVGGLIGSIIGGVAGIPGGPLGIAAGIAGGGATGAAVGAGTGGAVGAAFDWYRAHSMHTQDAASSMETFTGMPTGSLSNVSGTPHMTSVRGLDDSTWTAASQATGGVVSPELLSALARTESGSKGMEAVSPKGAIGTMQLMPSTAAQYGVNPYDQAGNILGGAEYMADLMKRYHSNEALALGAYNAGPGRMDRVLAGKATLPEETKNYIATVLAREGKTGSLQIGSVTIQITQRPGESQQDLANRTVATLRDTADKQVQRNLQASSNMAWNYGG